jgi:hypothetical protein
MIQHKKKYIEAKKCKERKAKSEGTGMENYEEEADVSVFLNTPLHWSSFKGHMATTLSLLDAGYSTSDVDAIGNTPLHLACASQNKSVVELLIASGADTNARNLYQLTPLDVATSHEVRTAIDSITKVNDELQQEKKLQRDVLREHQSSTLRGIAASLSELVEMDRPQNLQEEEVRLEHLQEALYAAIETNGAVDEDVIKRAQSSVNCFKVSIDMRKHLSETKSQQPVVTQRAYCAFVNKLEKYVKIGEKVGVDPALVEDAKSVIAMSFAEFWLFKVKEELEPIECATKGIEPRIDLLEARIEKAQQLEASESLIASSFKVLERFRSEVALAVTMDNIPTYKLPPPAEETAELSKKQLAAFMESYWEADDLGHIKETTVEDGCNPFPLPPGFGKTDEDEEWANNPIKQLINTPEGYIWVPSKNLVNLREAAKNLDVALIRATNSGAFAPLLEKARVRMQELENDIQQLELKDETDMTLAEAAASKASKKMKKDMKGGGKKKTK